MGFGLVLVLLSSFCPVIVLGIVFVCRTWYSPSLQNASNAKMQKNWKLSGPVVTVSMILIFKLRQGAYMGRFCWSVCWLLEKSVEKCGKQNRHWVRNSLLICSINYFFVNYTSIEWELSIYCFVTNNLNNSKHPTQRSFSMQFNVQTGSS